MQYTRWKDENDEPNKSHDETRKHGRHLKLRSWGVKTLHHYERISSRDLEWHRGKRKRKRRGKIKLLLWQTSETEEPCEVEKIERENITEINKVENTPSEKRNKEEQIQIALQFKRDARLDKMKRT